MSFKKDETIRVLHIFQYFRPDFTGEGLYWTKLNPLLDYRKILSDVLVIRSTVNISTADGYKGLQGSKFHKIYRVSRKKAPNWLSSFRFLLWLLANGSRYDIFHFHSHVNRWFLADLIVRSFGAKLIRSCTLSDSPQHLIQSYKPVFRFLVARLLRLIDIYVAISPKLLDGCVYQGNKYKATLIPQGVLEPPKSVTDRSALRKEHGFKDGDIILLYVGGICERKDIEFLVRNHGRISHSGGTAQLLIVGPILEPDYSMLLEKRIFELGLGKNIRFLGYQDELESLYAMADIFVFSSKEEGFGNVLLEAMARSLSVVSRKLPGVTDFIITHNTTGFLFDDDNGYVEIMNDLLVNPDIRRVVGSSARQIVLTRFRMESVAEMYDRLYREA